MIWRWPWAARRERRVAEREAEARAARRAEFDARHPYTWNGRQS